MQAELRSHIFLPESVLMNEYLFDRHVKQIGYIHCKLKRRSTSAVLNGTDGLPRYTELLHKEILPYLLLFSDLCEIVLHKSPYRTLVQLYIAILSCNQIVSSVLYVYDNHKKICRHATDLRGAQARNRTRDTGIFSPLLYLLSYLSIMVGHLGVEPRTDRL